MDVMGGHNEIAGSLMHSNGQHLANDCLIFRLFLPSKQLYVKSISEMLSILLFLHNNRNLFQI